MAKVLSLHEVGLRPDTDEHELYCAPKIGSSATVVLCRCSKDFKPQKFEAGVSIH